MTSHSSGDSELLDDETFGPDADIAAIMASRSAQLDGTDADDFGDMQSVLKALEDDESKDRRGNKLLATPSRGPVAAPGASPSMRSAAPLAGSSSILTAGELEQQLRGPAPTTGEPSLASLLLGPPSGSGPGTTTTTTASSTSSSSSAPTKSAQETERSVWHLPLPRDLHPQWMSKYEIVNVLRTQLAQIQSTDPLSDDFYAQVYSHRQGRAVGSGIPLATLRSSIYRASWRNVDGSIRLPEGTLGRVDCSSVRKPRRLMDLRVAGAAEELDYDAAVSASDEAQPSRSNMFSSMTLGFLIEEGFRFVMELEDIEAMMGALPPVSRLDDPVRLHEQQVLESQRQGALARVIDALALQDAEEEDPLLLTFARSHKGRMLIHRVLPLLPTEKRAMVLSRLCARLLELSSPPLSWNPGPADESLARTICDELATLPVNEGAVCLIVVMHGREPDELAPLFKTKLGNSVVQGVSRCVFSAKRMGHPAMVPHTELAVKMLGMLLGFLRGQLQSIFDSASTSSKPQAGGEGGSSSAEQEARAFTQAFVGDVWETMACLYSHATTSDREWFGEELRPILQKIVQAMRERNPNPASLPPPLLFLGTQLGLIAPPVQPPQPQPQPMPMPMQMQPPAPVADDQTQPGEETPRSASSQPPAAPPGLAQQQQQQQQQAMPPAPLPLPPHLQQQQHARMHPVHGHPHPHPHPHPHAHAHLHPHGHGHGHAHAHPMPLHMMGPPPPMPLPGAPPAPLPLPQAAGAGASMPPVLAAMLAQAQHHQHQHQHQHQQPPLPPMGMMPLPHPHMMPPPHFPHPHLHHGLQPHMRHGPPPPGLVAQGMPPTPAPAPAPVAGVGEPEAPSSAPAPTAAAAEPARGPRGPGQATMAKGPQAGGAWARRPQVGGQQPPAAGPAAGLAPTPLQPQSQPGSAAPTPSRRPQLQYRPVQRQ